MKYVIFGGGPCGMRLADELSKKGEKVDLYEEKEKLGGCWKAEWKDGYFIEHAPRVMTTNYERVIDLVDSLNLKDPYNDVYGSSFNATKMFIKYTLSNLSFLDIAKFTMTMWSISLDDPRTVQEWMDGNNITTRGKKAISNLSISLATVPDDLSAYCFFDAIYQGFGKGKFIQFREGDMWLKKWEARIRSRKNVKIYKNCKLTGLVSENGKIKYAKTQKGRVNGDVFICSFPLWNLQELIKNCDDDIKNNWLPEKQFIDFCKNSSYTAIGIQLHFSKKMELEMSWCQTCMGEWSIILLETSKFQENFTKKKGIKEVWSCALVDFATKSETTGKKPGKMTYEEIGLEVLNQLEKTLNRKLKPKMITVNVDFNRKGKWEPRESAYASTPFGTLPAKGKKISNLYSVGCQNRYEIAVLDGAIGAADKFISSYA